MKKLVALSAIGSDRPGIVAALARAFFETGCNLENSSMTLLKGDFAVLLLISMPENITVNELNRKIQKVADTMGLTFSIRELSERETSESPVPTLPHTLVVYGVDHPGIVYRVAQALAERSINITDLRTHVTQAQGTPLYSLIMEVEIPTEESAKVLRSDLETLGKELKVEVTLIPVEADEL
jgi:glycine cleavage system transcriptional repressor